MGRLGSRGSGGAKIKNWDMLGRVQKWCIRNMSATKKAKRTKKKANDERTETYWRDAMHHLQEQPYDDPQNPLPLYVQMSEFHNFLDKHWRTPKLPNTIGLHQKKPDKFGTARTFRSFFKKENRKRQSLFAHATQKICAGKVQKSKKK